MAKACDERNSDKPKATAPAAPEPGKGGELGARLEAASDKGLPRAPAVMLRRVSGPGQ